MGGPSLRLPLVVLQTAVVLWGKRGTSWEGPHLKCPMLCFSLLLWEKEAQDWEAPWWPQ